MKTHSLPELGGVRPSPGAETSGGYATQECFKTVVTSHASAPEDGRTPVQGFKMRDPLSGNSLTGLLVALVLLAGCGESKHSGHGHHHTPPHGGTPVILGNEDYHLEFVLDASNGKI